MTSSVGTPSVFNACQNSYDCNGTFGIVLGRNHQGRRPYLLDETNGRALFVNCRIIVNGCAEERDHPLVDAVLAIVALPVRDSGAGYCCLEAVCLRDGPHCHVAAVAPTRHPQT